MVSRDNITFALYLNIISYYETLLADQQFFQDKDSISTSILSWSFDDA